MTMTAILIIDDEQPTLQMLTLYLEACGHTVLTAENEIQGLDVFPAFSDHLADDSILWGFQT